MKFSSNNFLVTLTIIILIISFSILIYRINVA